MDHFPKDWGENSKHLWVATTPKFGCTLQNILWASGLQVDMVDCPASWPTAPWICGKQWLLDRFFRSWGKPRKAIQTYVLHDFCEQKKTRPKFVVLRLWWWEVVSSHANVTYAGKMMILHGKLHLEHFPLSIADHVIAQKYCQIMMQFQFYLKMVVDFERNGPNLEQFGRLWSHVYQPRLCEAIINASGASAKIARIGPASKVAKKLNSSSELSAQSASKNPPPNFPELGPPLEQQRGK